MEIGKLIQDLMASLVEGRAGEAEVTLLGAAMALRNLELHEESVAGQRAQAALLAEHGKRQTVALERIAKALEQWGYDEH